MVDPARPTGPCVASGLDVILEERRGLLEGRRVGLVTSASGVTSDLTPAVDALQERCTLVALFGPEHGITGHIADAKRISSTIDPHSGLPVYSLYGETRKPSAEMLGGIDLLMFDVQDVGVRFYTYTWTMDYVLEAAGEHGVPMVVLDRPNPIGGEICEGPVLEPGYKSFVGNYRIPLRHGMTIGELALFLNEDRGLNADLTVVEAKGWERRMWFDQTGLPWVSPSPAIPKLDTAIVYPGTCLIEGTSLSEGRGTPTPFEGIGAPWIDGHRWASALNDLGLPGVRFRPLSFKPTAHKHAGAVCQGVFVHVMDRQAFRPLWTGLHILATVRSLWPDDFAWRKTSWEGRLPHFDLLIGNGRVREQLEAERPIDQIFGQWQEGLAEFKALRRNHLLYE